MEANLNNSNQVVSTGLTLAVPSKKIQINSIEDENVKALLESKEKYEEVIAIKLEGNSYSLTFCKSLGEILRQTKSIKDLNINDIFVARLKEEIPQSIENISKGLIGSGLLRLDISNNAVNPFGAEALLHYLKQASTLQVLLIYNCGLGSRGMEKIGEGLVGTPSLRTLSIGRNKMNDEGINHISKNLKFVPHLEELFVYQNSLNNQGLPSLIQNLRLHCKNLRTLDVGDNHLKGPSKSELILLIKENLNLRNLNLSDMFSEETIGTVVLGFKESTNRSWERLGFNYSYPKKKEARILLQVLKECPLKKLDITGNDFDEDLQQEFTQAFPEGVLSPFDDEDTDEVIKLFEELKL